MEMGPHKKAFGQLYAAFLAVCIIFCVSSCGLLPASNSAGQAAPLSNDWLGDHGLAVSRQGTFYIDIMGVSGNVFRTPCTVEITEGSAENTGYKTVVAEIEYDFSKLFKGEASFWYWTNVFDRYTGQCFNITNKNLEGDQTKKCNSTILLDGVPYYIEGEYESDEGAEKEAVTIRVVVPEGYDGTVFQIGFNSEAESEAADIGFDDGDINFIDEKDTFELQNYYFTLNDA